MNLRQYERWVRIKVETIQEEEKRQWQRTAVEVAYMMNMVGGAAGGKKWKQVSPNKLLKQWLEGESKKEDFWTRWDRAMELHNARLEREVKKKASLLQ